MKPCYQQGDHFYLLTHVIREGDQNFPQPCKALISPGVLWYVVRNSSSTERGIIETSISSYLEHRLSLEKVKAKYGVTGSCPTITRVSGEFLQRCGWRTSKAPSTEQDSEIAIVEKADFPEETAQLVHSKLVVGACQLSTVLQIVESVDLPDQCVLSNWHIHVGKKDLEALQRNAWDADICYLPASPEQVEGDTL